MKKYNSIEQFRNVIRKVRESHDFKGLDSEGNPIFSHDSPYPTKLFKGTVKVHGTNAAIVMYSGGEIKYQSRERELQIGNDNMGFCAFASGLPVLDYMQSLVSRCISTPKEYVAIYGEWFGKGIQKGVGVSGVERSFVVFDVVIDGEHRMDLVSHVHDPKNRVYSINHFPTYFVEVDFNNPELAQNKLIELTLQVEENCPVARLLGSPGIGEGIVFHLVDNPAFKFKSKGEKHSSSKVKVLNSVDTEKLKGILDFVEYVCTESRLNQGLEHVELDIKNTGKFIKWVNDDVLKEESDTLVANGIVWKEAAGRIAKKASEFFKSKLYV